MCPTPFLPPDCQDITRAATADATLAGLLATAASVFLVLILQAKKSSTKPKDRNTILGLLVSTFFSSLLASFTFGLLTGEMPTIRVDVLLNFAASPILIVGALQFLSSIGWLLKLYQAEETPFIIARRAFLLGRGLTIVYLALDCFDFLNEKTQGALPGAVYDGAALLVALLIVIIAWRIPRVVYNGVSLLVALLIIIITWRVPQGLKSRKKEIDYPRIYATSGLFIAAACTLLYGIMSDFSPTDLQNSPDWIYYFGVFLLMVALGWFVCVSEMSWPPQPPESSERSAELPKNHPEPSTDDKLGEEESPAPLKELAASAAKRRPRKKPADPSLERTE